MAAKIDVFDWVDTIITSKEVILSKPVSDRRITVMADDYLDLVSVVRAMIKRGYIPTRSFLGRGDYTPWCIRDNGEFRNVFNQGMTLLDKGEANDIVDYSIFYEKGMCTDAVASGFDNLPVRKLNGEFVLSDGWKLLDGHVERREWFYACVKHKERETPFDPDAPAEGDIVLEAPGWVRVRRYKCEDRVISWYELMKRTDDITEEWGITYDESKCSPWPAGVVVHADGTFTVFERREKYIHKKTYPAYFEYEIFDKARFGN